MRPKSTREKLGWTIAGAAAVAVAAWLVVPLPAQIEQQPEDSDTTLISQTGFPPPPPGAIPGGRQRPGGRGGFGGMGGFGGRGGGDVELVETYDEDGDGILNSEERAAARQDPAIQGRSGRSSGGFGSSSVPVGGELTPDQVETYSEESLYDMTTLRTLFLEFENEDWEQELEAFNNTDVDVPAVLTVDGVEYPGVGVRFRGNTSYSNVGTGWKRPLNLSINYVDDDQRLGGYRTLNLLNSFGDPTFLRTVFFLQIARDYIPAPKANYVRLVINGEDWGVYINVQQFNSDFIREWFGDNDGVRWKVPQNSGGGLSYWGDDPASYQRAYEIKNDDEPESWAALINLTKVLNQTPPEELEAALEPVMDIDEVLKFLAIDKALSNSDGYWARASDVSLYMDVDGRFHVFPYDTNEAMASSGRGGGGRSRRGGGGGGATLDPYAGAYDSDKPLLSKLLAVDSLRERYLGYLGDIAERWLDWEKLGPLAEQYQALIAADIETDAHNLFSAQQFASGVTELKDFIEQRREYLLSHPDIQ